MSQPPSRPWLRIPVPPRVKRIPTMLYDEEMQYLVWLGEHQYQGWGAIVDLGPWIGSSSAALAEGLSRRSPPAPAKVVSIDTFEWLRHYMENHSPENLPDGADFSHVFRRETADWAEWVEPRKHDLQTYRWDGGPIEILFLDAAKSWSLVSAILAGFGRALVPGRTRIVVQDFRHFETHWLPLIFDGRPDLWHELESTHFAMTVTFVPLKLVMGPEGIGAGYSEDSFPFAVAEPLLRARIEAAETRWQRCSFLRMLYRKALIDGPAEAARAVREELLADPDYGPRPEELAQLCDLSSTLLPRAWEACRRDDFAQAAAIAERCMANGFRSAYALDVVGYARLAQGDHDAAERALLEAAQVDPESSSVWTHLAQVRLAQRRLGEAEDCARRALETGRGLEIHVQYALEVLADIESKGGSAERSAAILHELTGPLAGSANFWTALAKAQSRQGLHTAARASLEKALALAPDLPGAKHLRALWSLPSPR